MSRTFCPECDEGIALGREAKVGLKLICPHCDAELEVIGTDPLELDWAYDWSWEEEVQGSY